MAAVETWEDTPTFSDLAGGIYEYLQITYHEVFVEPRPPIKVDSWNITTYDITCVLVLTAVFSTLRYVLDKYIPPITRQYDIPEANGKRVSEHAWRFTYFLCAWCYEWYVIVLSGRYKFFQKPETVWHGWSLETSPPGDIYSLHVMEWAFYIHWTYATLYLDEWRKDSVVMVFHHIAVLSLLFVANAAHSHNIGVIMFLVHDITDVFLELGKLCSYFMIQGLKVHAWIKRMGIVSLACFAASWCTFRLYWFPLKVMYAGAVYPQRLGLNIPYLFLMNLIAWIQLCLNIYWLMWILRAIYGVARKRLQDPRDIGKNGKRSA